MRFEEFKNPSYDLVFCKNALINTFNKNKEHCSITVQDNGRCYEMQTADGVNVEISEVECKGIFKHAF